MGSDRLCAWHNRLPTSGASPDEQAQDGCSDERHGARGVGNGIRGQVIGSRYRVWREASARGQEGAATPIRQNGDSVLPSRLATYLRGVDGTGGRSNGKDCAVPGAHFNPRNIQYLCPLQPVIHAGCEPCGGVLEVLPYTQGHGVHGAKCLETWWALTDSNRRPSRCKWEGLTANCGFCARNCTDFRNMCRFRFASVRRCGTHVHAGPMERANAHTGPNQDAKGPRNG